MIPTNTAVRLAPFVIVALVWAIYHGSGLHFLYGNDTWGYLKQANSLFGSGAYERPSDRAVGYPLFLAGVFTVSNTALALIFAQASLVALAYGLLYVNLKQASVDLAPVDTNFRWPWGAVLAIGLAATTSYSALQVFILSMNPEILHAVLALIAVLAVASLVRLGPDGGG